MVRPLEPTALAKQGSPSGTEVVCSVTENSNSGTEDPSAEATAPPTRSSTIVGAASWNAVADAQAEAHLTLVASVVASLHAPAPKPVRRTTRSRNLITFRMLSLAQVP